MDKLLIIFMLLILSVISYASAVTDGIMVRNSSQIFCAVFKDSRVTVYLSDSLGRVERLVGPVPVIFNKRSGNIMSSDNESFLFYAGDKFARVAASFGQDFVFDYLEYSTRCPSAIERIREK